MFRIEQFQADGIWDYVLHMKAYWDIHNHILPGVDDGASCLSETEALLKEAYAQGVRHIVFTPHYRKGMFEIGADSRLAIFRQVNEFYRSKLAQQLPGMSFNLGCEFFVHGADFELLKNRVFRMPGNHVVLAEFSPADDLKAVVRILDKLADRGYTAVIAHIERYTLSIDDVRKISDYPNVYIQVNAGSIAGSEGFLTARRSRKLVDAGLVSLIGSDTHDIRHRKMNIEKCAMWLDKHYGAGAVDRLLISNPAEVFSEDLHE